MGSGGLFAQIGRFHSPALGNFRMYLTDQDDAVLVHTDERFVISPADSGRFVAEALTRKALRAAPQPTGGE